MKKAICFSFAKFMDEITLRQDYKRLKKKKVIFLISLLIILVFFVILSLCVGSSNLSFQDSFLAIFGQGDPTNVTILYNIRMPRMLAGLLSGFGLAISGYVMQNLLKNPMASPSTLGVSNGAVFGANLAIIAFNAGHINSSQGTEITISNPYLTTFCALFFSVLSIFFIMLLSSRSKFSSETVVLSGVAIGSLFTAMTTILQFFATDTQLSSAVFWQFGDLGYVTYTENLIMFIVIIASFIYLFLNRWNHNALLNGDDVAKSLGVKVNITKILGLVLASLICAVCVSFIGIIGFIGLVAPHIVKRVIGNDYKFTLPCTALCGASLILFADTLSKLFINGISFPVGAITSLFGAPLFLYLLLRKKER